MKITYDPEVDALYIRFVSHEAEALTRRVTDEIAINETADGQVIGIEVLDASHTVFDPSGARIVEVEGLTIAGAR
jgi:uncharacterized protein YuzE